MPELKLTHINYAELNSRQKEAYNFQKLAAALADYGFNCIKLSDDWQGADFLAYCHCHYLKVRRNAGNNFRIKLKVIFPQYSSVLCQSI